MANVKNDAAADLLIREVDEDLRQENMIRLWKKYGAVLVAGAVAIVLAVAGTEGWQAWQARQRQQASTRFDEAAAALKQGDKAKGQEILAQLAASGPDGYKVLALMKQGEQKAAAGDAAGAAALYDGVAAMAGVDEAYRHIAALKAAYLKVETADPAVVEAVARPLAAETSPWRHSARELLALVALRRGDRAQALDQWRKLADDPSAPAGIRGRAAEMLAALENGAKG